jgi:hypothetical protein
VSFGRNSIRWRGVDYELQAGQLVLREPQKVSGSAKLAEEK